jgi:hypothetical protein
MRAARRRIFGAFRVVRLGLDREKYAGHRVGGRVT